LVLVENCIQMNYHSPNDIWKFLFLIILLTVLINISSAETFPESLHNYANNDQCTWSITRSGANQIRVHFTKMEIGYRDSLQILDENDNVLKTYTGTYYAFESPILLEDYWSEWYASNTIKLKLITDKSDTYYGFKIDNVEDRFTEQPVDQNVYESWHTYANNYKSIWIINEPGTNYIRVHFTKMEIGYRDSLQILDENDNVLKTYTGTYYAFESPILLEDYWSERYASNTIKLKLITDKSDTYYGFKIDKVDKDSTVSTNTVSPTSSILRTPDSTPSLSTPPITPSTTTLTAHITSIPTTTFVHTVNPITVPSTSNAPTNSQSATKFTPTITTTFSNSITSSSTVPTSSNAALQIPNTIPTTSLSSVQTSADEINEKISYISLIQVTGIIFSVIIGLIALLYGPGILKRR
jgi:hypothetical protein